MEKLSTQSHSNINQELLLTAESLAEKLSISLRHLHALNASGKLPRPIKLGRSTRWNALEISNWIIAGCPPRDRWEQLKSQP